MVTGRKVLVAIGGLLLIGLVALILPDCTRSRVLIVNGSTSEIEPLVLIMREHIVWSGRLGTHEARRIAVAVRASDPFLLTGRYAETGSRFLEYSSYASYYSGRIHLFLIKDAGVHAGEWRDPSWPPSKEMTIRDEVRVFGALFLDLMSCADHALWTLIRSSPKY